MTADHPQRRDETVPSVLSRSVSGAPLRELTRDALRVALQDAEGGRVPEGSVRAMLRQVCEQARACDARVEHLLVLLKQACLELPEARRANHGDAQDALARVITLCIEEYYGARSVVRADRS